MSELSKEEMSEAVKTFNYERDGILNKILEKWDEFSRYGETKDLVDKVKLYSNLRLKAYETGVHSSEGGAVRDEADAVLEEIAKDTDRLVELSCRGDDVGTGYRMLDQYRRYLDNADEVMQKELLELLESIFPVWIHEAFHLANAEMYKEVRKPLRVEHKGGGIMVTFPITSNEAQDRAGVGDDVFVEGRRQGIDE